MSKRGRPTFEPTAEQRKKVLKLSGDGNSIADIARLTKISKPTLRRYFPDELISGKRNRAGKKTAAPKFKITTALRLRVSRLIGGGMEPGEIAIVLGCTEEQLREHFEPDIANGRIRFRAQAIDDLAFQSASGKTSATNQIMALTAPTSDVAQQPAIPGTAGKKAAATANAQRMAAAGGMFAPPAPPKLIVDNSNKG